MNETWPEFVTDKEERTSKAAKAVRTGWETVVFELQDAELDRLLSTLEERVR